MAESSVSFGADAEMGNFYVGTWWADVDKGVEYDIYADTTFTNGYSNVRWIYWLLLFR